VYDMYPWDSAGSASPGGRPPQTPPVWGEPSPQTPRPPRRGGSPSPLTPQQWAVQFALDRRDNGGEALDTLDALSGLGQPSASPARQ
jgi:hypothetical protein